VALGLREKDVSVYSIHKIAHLVQKDPAFRQRMKDDPAAAIAEFRLTDEERRALLTGDVGTLAQMGTHGYVLGALARYQIVGLNMQNYPQLIHDPGSTA
jgi:hypothetical protein